MSTHIPSGLTQWYHTSNVSIPEVEVQRRIEQYKSQRMQRTVNGFLKLILNRLVQSRHRRVRTFPLGFMAQEEFFEWLGRSLMKPKPKSRPSVENDGDSVTDTILKYRFVGDQLRNLPLSYVDWFHFHVQEKRHAKRRLYFRITEITLKYNINQEYLEAAFIYTVMTPTFEEVSESEYDWIWTCVA